MGRNFDGVGDKVDLGDLASPANFPRASAWSIIAFFRIENSAGDDRAIVSKQGSGSTTRQFSLRTDAQAAPSNLEVYHGNGFLAVAIEGGDNVALNTWYLVCVTCSGAQAAGDLALYLVGMDDTYLDDGVTGDTDADATADNGSVTFGETDAGSDDMDGDMAYVTYVNRALGKNDISAYLRDPIGTAKAWEVQSGIEYCFPIWGAHSPEIDLSPNARVGTLTGTTKGQDPPVDSIWTISPVPVVVAGGVAGIRNPMAGPMTLRTPLGVA